MAAAVNVHFLLTIGVSVSHLTGDVARVGAEFVTAGPDFADHIAPLAMVLLGFLTGAAAAGYILHSRQLELQRPYGRSITGIGALILTAGAMPSPAAAALLCAIACGFQNGMATHYRGLILRTTHITGVLTDLGQMAGMRAAGKRIETWKLAAQASLTLAFALGSLCGTALHLLAGGATLYILGGAYVLGGFGWTLFKHLILKPEPVHFAPPL